MATPRSLLTRTRLGTAVALLGVVLGVVLAGCGDGEGATPIPTPVAVPSVPGTAEPSPTATAAATASPVVSPTATATAGMGVASEATEGGPTLDVFVVRDGAGRLWVEPVPVPYDPDEVGVAVARESVRLLLEAEAGEGTSSLVPTGTELRGVDLDDDVLTVDLSGDVRTDPGAGAEAEAAFAQQLAHTAAQHDTVGSVVLRVEGQPVEELWGHLDWSAPIEPDPFAVSPIVVAQVEAADARADRAGAIELAGTANVFEATVEVVVTGPGGAVVDEGFVTATCGTGCRGDWTYRLDGLGPGTYEVVLREPDPSDGEGRPPFEVVREVEVG